jgi:hypothetical protein
MRSIFFVLVGMSMALTAKADGGIDFVQLQDGNENYLIVMMDGSSPENLERYPNFAKVLAVRWEAFLVDHYVKEGVFKPEASIQAQMKTSEKILDTRSNYVFVVKDSGYPIRNLGDVAQRVAMRTPVATLRVAYQSREVPRLPHELRLVGRGLQHSEIEKSAQIDPKKIEKVRIVEKGPLTVGGHLVKEIPTREITGRAADFTSAEIKNFAKSGAVSGDLGTVMMHLAEAKGWLSEGPMKDPETKKPLPISRLVIETVHEQERNLAIAEPILDSDNTVPDTVRPPENIRGLQKGYERAGFRVDTEIPQDPDLSDRGVVILSTHRKVSPEKGEPDIRSVLQKQRAGGIATRAGKDILSVAKVQQFTPSAAEVRKIDIATRAAARDLFFKALQGGFGACWELFVKLPHFN